MRIQGVNHFCFSVEDLERASNFYEHALGARLLVRGRTLAYFELAGYWIALNEEKGVERQNNSYTHIAFSVEVEDLSDWEKHLRGHNVTIVPSRQRDERDGHSLYFTDPDGHRFELHTGTLQQRIAYYRETKTHMFFPRDENEEVTHDAFINQLVE
ncbi:MAG: metallothiol transferase FosB [Bacilli bacterium]